MRKIILSFMASVSIVSIPPVYAQTPTSGIINNTSDEQCEDNDYLPVYNVADDGASDSLSESGSGETNAIVKARQAEASKPSTPIPSTPIPSSPPIPSTNPSTPSNQNKEAIVRVPNANRTVGGQPVIAKSPHVRTAKLKAPMRSILNDIYAVAKRMGMPTPVITSAADSTHQVGSRHYTGDAIDLRCNIAFASVARCSAYAKELARVFGKDYDVIFEIYPKDPANNHIHIEYDPN